MPTELKVVLFDLGGVLIELVGVPTMLSWIPGDVTSKQLWVKWLTSPAVRAFETGRISPEQFAEQFVDEMSLPVAPETFMHEFTYWPQGLFPGALDLVRRIPPAYTLAALSNTNALHWPRMMHEMGLADVFQHCFASHLMGKLKPDRDAFEHVIEVLDCEPSAVLFMDDNALNVEAARQMGFNAIEVDGLEGAEAQLKAHRIIA